MNSFATCADQVTQRRNARACTRAKVDGDGIIFNLALAHIRHRDRHEREPDFGDYPGRQERRCRPCSRIGVGTGVWADLLLRGKTAAKVSFSVPAGISRTWDRRCRSDAQRPFASRASWGS